VCSICRSAHSHGKKAGIFCGNGEVARDMVQRGFDLVCPGFDIGYLTTNAAEELAKYKQTESTGGKGY
jgi:4-hydroxy-2-oxoheptanedioate aldolase